MTKPFLASDVPLDTPIHVLPFILREMGMTTSEKLALITRYKLVSENEFVTATNNDTEYMLVEEVTKDLDFVKEGGPLADLMLGMARIFADKTNDPNVSARSFYGHLRMLAMVAARRQPDPNTIKDLPSRSGPVEAKNLHIPNIP